MSEEEVAAALAKIRYSKIIVMADADADGQHIECLSLGYFFRHMYPIIEHGHVYISLPPLYRVTEKGKHTFLKDEAALTAYFRRRARSVVGSESGLVDIAGHATRIRQILNNAAHTYGVTTSCMAFAVPLFKHYIASSEEEASGVFIQKYVDARAAYCECVEHKVTEQGITIVEGLEPSGSFFTTVIDQQFIVAVAECYDQIKTLIGEDLIVEGGMMVGEVACYDIYQVVDEIERISRRGVDIQRNKGLGEMQAEDLGETTIDLKTRRLIQVTVDDFDSAGNVLSNLLSTKGVEARRELLHRVTVDRELIDA